MALAVAGDALACTCAPVDLVRDLPTADGAFVGTMVHELRRNGGGLGLAAICSGGGQGDALLLEV